MCEHVDGSTTFSFQTQFLQFVWIFSNKIHLNVNIFDTLALKIVKQTLWNLAQWGLSNNTKNAPKFE
jgi:hypothetical protein